MILCIISYLNYNNIICINDSSLRFGELKQKMPPSRSAVPLCRTVEQILMRTRPALIYANAVIRCTQRKTVCMSNRSKSTSVSSIWRVRSYQFVEFRCGALPVCGVLVLIADFHVIMYLGNLMFWDKHLLFTMRLTL